MVKVKAKAMIKWLRFYSIVDYLLIFIFAGSHIYAIWYLVKHGFITDLLYIFLN